MKRLREIEPRSSLLSSAQKLLDSVEPLPESQERMQRIRRGLERDRGVVAFVRRLPTAAAALLVVAFGASAFAAVRLYVAADPAPERSGEQSVPPARVEKPRARQPSQKVAAPTAEALPPAVDPSPEPAALPASQSRNRERMHVAPRANAARTSEPDPSSEPDPGSGPDSQPQPPVQPVATDSELVHRAVKALRRDGDPALAARLLAERRARDPGGPLAEEALSLQIEAALAQGDPRGQALAREYLARYPSGRYVAIARRALQE